VATPGPKAYLAGHGLGGVPVRHVGHHHAHAAAGYFTSGFRDAAILVVDAIGEWDTISLWEGIGTGLRRVWSQRYPHSLGLFYSAFTQRCGFKPNEEEYIMMGMAALGTPIYASLIERDFISTRHGMSFKLHENLHRGVRGWRPEITDVENIAASVQCITEEYLCSLVAQIARMTTSKNLVLMGGVALNCVANARIARTGLFDALWIMPNPGDAGSSLGAVAAHTGMPLDWRHPYLGTDIDRPFDHDGALNALLRGEVIGIANGRAEFGPRALGNRSLICDPRGQHMKDAVNRLKRREEFRPFAPVIMEHLAHTCFDLPVATSPYMQFTAPCRFPDRFPAICHVDNTSRVQTLAAEQNPRFYRLLEMFFAATGCPMLLNTSLNIKGEPLVDTWEDALRFQRETGFRVF
jgi:carbamoyltransferase